MLPKPHFYFPSYLSLTFHDAENQHQHLLHSNREQSQSAQIHRVNWPWSATAPKLAQMTKRTHGPLCLQQIATPRNAYVKLEAR
jgi:hypothetical protein